MKQLDIEVSPPASVINFNKDIKVCAKEHCLTFLTSWPWPLTMSLVTIHTKSDVKHTKLEIIIFDNVTLTFDLTFTYNIEIKI